MYRTSSVQVQVTFTSVLHYHVPNSQGKVNLSVKDDHLEHSHWTTAKVLDSIQPNINPDNAIQFYISTPDPITLEKSDIRRKVGVSCIPFVHIRQMINCTLLINSPSLTIRPYSTEETAFNLKKCLGASYYLSVFIHNIRSSVHQV